MISPRLYADIIRRFLAAVDNGIVPRKLLEGQSIDVTCRRGTPPYSGTDELDFIFQVQGRQVVVDGTVRLPDLLDKDVVSFFFTDPKSGEEGHFMAYVDEREIIARYRPYECD